MLSHVVVALKWHKRLMRYSRLLLPIVLRRKWSIVLNHSDFSCCCGSDTLILTLLQETVDSAILKSWKSFNSILYFNFRRLR